MHACAYICTYVLIIILVISIRACRYTGIYTCTSACYYYSLDLDEEEAACLLPMPVIDSVKLRSGRRAVQRVCFGFDDDFEEPLNQALKQSAICASDRLRLGVSVEDNADAADDDDGEDEEDTGSVD